jgi:hypothetical protein
MHRINGDLSTTADDARGAVLNSPERGERRLPV